MNVKLQSVTSTRMKKKIKIYIIFWFYVGIVFAVILLIHQVPEDHIVTSKARPYYIIYNNSKWPVK